MITDGTDREQRQALAVFVKLMRAAESVSNAVHSQLVAERLTISQFGVLEALYHLGPMCQKDLAGKILKSTGNITMVLDNLEKRELVTRQRSTTDRRYVLVGLSAAGRELIGRIFPAHAARIGKRMAVLERQELTQLEALLKKLGRCLKGNDLPEETPKNQAGRPVAREKRADSVVSQEKRPATRG